MRLHYKKGTIETYTCNIYIYIYIESKIYIETETVLPTRLSHKHQQSLIQTYHGYRAVLSQTLKSRLKRNSIINLNRRT